LAACPGSLSLLAATVRLAGRLLHASRALALGLAPAQPTWRQFNLRAVGDL